MSAGGVLGGLCAALIAPLLFDWVYEHPLLILAAALLLPLPRLIAWDRAFALSPRRARILVALLVAIAGFAACRMVAGCTGLLDGATALWGAAVFAIGLFVLGWTRHFTPVLRLLILRIGGWSTVPAH